MTRGKRRDSQRVEDMLKAVREMREEVRGMGRAEYAQNRTLQKAVTYDIMILGDAASRISQRTKKSNPSVPWAQLAAYRSNEEHGPAHAYFEFDLAETWPFVRDTLPDLARKLRRVKIAPGDSD
jgi:uncharacterized protein with HEPN domain